MLTRRKRKNLRKSIKGGSTRVAFGSTLHATAEKAAPTATAAATAKVATKVAATAAAIPTQFKFKNAFKEENLKSLNANFAQFVSDTFKIDNTSNNNANTIYIGLYNKDIVFGSSTDDVDHTYTIPNNEENKQLVKKIKLLLSGIFAKYKDNTTFDTFKEELLKGANSQRLIDLFDKTCFKDKEELNIYRIFTIDPSKTMMDPGRLRYRDELQLGLKTFNFEYKKDKSLAKKIKPLEHDTQIQFTHEKNLQDIVIQGIDVLTGKNTGSYSKLNGNMVTYINQNKTLIIANNHCLKISIDDDADKFCEATDINIKKFEEMISKSLTFYNKLGIPSFDKPTWFKLLINSQTHPG